MKKYLLCFFGALALYTTTAQAAFIGESIECASDGFFTGCNPTNAVVGGGIEFDIETPIAGYHWSLDIGENSVIFQDLSTGGSFGGHGQIFLTGFDFNIITGIENFFTDVSTGIAATDVSFTSDSITIDARSSNWQSLQLLSFDVVTSTSSVPEPTSMALLGLGVAGLGFSRKKKNA